MRQRSGRVVKRLDNGVVYIGPIEDPMGMLEEESEERIGKLFLEVKEAVNRFDETGCWPDHWQVGKFKKEGEVL